MGQKSQVVDPKKIRGTCRMVQKCDVILLEEVLHQAVVVNCSIVLLKDPVITTQTRALSHEGCPLQHVHIASRRLMPLHNLKLHYPIEGKSTPNHDGPSSTVLRRKHLQWDLLVMPVMLEAIRTVQVKFFSRRCHLMVIGLQVSISKGLNLGRGSACVFTDSPSDPPAQCRWFFWVLSLDILSHNSQDLLRNEKLLSYCIQPH